jgi:7-carboxy-7-deazaguanine synthase
MTQIPANLPTGWSSLLTPQLAGNNPAATIPISEIFGPTIQGEGPHAGTPVQFLRTGGCNLSCTWCDTPYTWDSTRYNLRTELTPMTAHDIVTRLQPNLPLVISGGEPLMHQNNLAFKTVLAEAVRHHCDIHIETNGTLPPSEHLRHHATAFAVSPKLDHAGTHKKRQNPALHPTWATIAKADPNTFLKVVVRNAQDVQQVTIMAAGIGWPLRQVWVMPVGTTTQALLADWAEIAAAAAHHHINATQRLHVLAWGDTKGT